MVLNSVSRYCTDLQVLHPLFILGLDARFRLEVSPPDAMIEYCFGVFETGASAGRCRGNRIGTEARFINQPRFSEKAVRVGP